MQALQTVLDLFDFTMRALMQRVSHAAVVVNGEEISAIGVGLLVFLGIEVVDDPSDVDWLAGKIANLRIFADADDKMNCDVSAIGGELLVVSQFTLHASTHKGNRPSFLRAARPQQAEPLYEKFCEALSIASDRAVKRGIFGADMKISLCNDGPVTILIDSRNRE